MNNFKMCFECLFLAKKGRESAKASRKDFVTCTYVEKSTIVGEIYIACT